MTDKGFGAEHEQEFFPHEKCQGNCSNCFANLAVIGSDIRLCGFGLLHTAIWEDMKRHGKTGEEPGAVSFVRDSQQQARREQLEELVTLNVKPGPALPFH